MAKKKAKAIAKAIAKALTVDDVMAELESLGNPQTVKTYRRHGADGDLFGVKVGDLKPIARRIRGQQELAIQLWDTNNSDAMYLAGLVADGSLMTRRQLNHWAKTAWWYMLGECSVPSVAAEHPDGFAIGRKWIQSRTENVQRGGWSTISNVVSVRDDDDLPLDQIRDLLKIVQTSINEVSSRNRYCMNHFLIAVGSFVKPLLKEAKAVAKVIGKVEVDMGDTSCKVPLASEYIGKVEAMGRVGKKRKSAKC